MVTEPTKRTAQPPNYRLPARFRVYGERDGVCIRVVVEPAGEGIITGFPDPGMC